MFPNPDYVYCTICGMALVGDTVVLVGPHWPTYNGTPLETEALDQEICRYAAEVDSYPGKLFLLPDREEVFPQHPYDSDFRSDKEPHIATAKMYIGIHAACDDLASHVIKSPFSSNIRSTSELWLTLERRCASYLGQRLQQCPLPRDMNYIPPIPNNLPGQPISLGFERYYIPEYCIENWGDEWGGWWDEDPIEIPDLTARLLSNLEPLDDISAEISTEVSPEQTNDYIYSFFQDTQSFPNDNYRISQSIWKEIFFQIPFLWDLDILAVYDRTGSNAKNVEKWNWEKLTRQVMSSPHPSPPDAASYRKEGIWSYEEVGLDVPGGFTNRRRIWQILEDMRPNDVQVGAPSVANT